MQKLPTNLLEAARFFANEQRCIDLVAGLKWDDGKPVCPKCGAAENGRKHYWLDTQKRWKCYVCRKQFSVKVNTIFEDSAIGLDKWLVALWMLVNCKNGISSYEIARDLKITQKSAWHVLHRLRHVLATKSIEKMGGTEGGPVEVDETYYGGDPDNKHRSKREPKWIKDKDGKEIKNPLFGKTAGRATKKIPVFGMLDRETREVRAHVMPLVRRDVLMDAILNNVQKGSTIYSDGLRDYKSLPELEFIHQTVDHVKEYVRGDVHTQGIENFWSLLKRGLKGTYVAVEPFHLDRYIAEQIFRYNYRATKENKLTDADRFALAVSQISDKRLTFAELTGKVPPSL